MVNWVNDGGLSDGASTRTAIGPSNETTVAAPGSVVLLHSQPLFFGVL